MKATQDTDPKTTDFFEQVFQKIKNHEELLLRLLRSASVPIIIVDESDIIQVFNRAAERMLGYEEKEVVGKFTPLLFHDQREFQKRAEEMGIAFDGTPAGFTKVRKAVAGNFPASMEWTYVDKNGRPFPVLLQYDILRDLQGSVLAYIAYITDLSNLRRAEKDREDSTVRLEKTTAQISGMVYQYRLDSEGKSSFPYVSEGIRKMLGLTPLEAVQRGDILEKMVHPEDAEPVRQSVLDSATYLTPWSREFRMIIPGRGERWFSCNSRPEQMPDGGTMWYGFMSDITEKKEAEQDLVKYSDFLSILAETASDFINLPIEEVETAIQRALRNVAEKVGADRAYIFEYDFEKKVSSNTFEWCSQGISSEIDNLQNIPMTGSEWATELHLKGMAFIEEDVPGMRHGVMRDLLLSQNIKSIITIPLMNPSQCEGFIGFDFVRSHHRFTERESNLLKFFSKMLAGIRIRRSAQEALETSEQRFRDMTDSAGEYVWEVDTEGRYVYVSERASELLGIPVQEMIGKTPFDFMPEEEVKRVGALFRSHLHSATPFTGVRHRSLRPDGTTIYQMVNGRPFFNSEGKLLGYRGLGMDITEEEKAKTALEQARQELEVFFESELNLLSIADLEGRFRRVSYSWERQLGLPLEAIEGARFMDFVHPDDVAGTKQVFEALLRKEEVNGFVNRYRHSDGDYRFIEWNARRVGSRIYSVAQDVSRKMEEERALHASLQREKETTEIKGRLISMASHEFRTPLATIQMAADMLEIYGERMDQQTIQKRLHLIASTTRELTRIITDLLDYSILEAGSPGVALETTDLVTASRTLAENLIEQEGQGHQLRFHSERQSAEVSLQFSLFKHALTNLVENAIKYSPPQSEVSVSLSWNREDGSARIEVADQGAGIPVAAIEKIWEPFFRVKEITTVPGTGLGLAIAKQAVEAMGGQIGCHPRNETGGTVFYFTIPYHGTTPAKKDDASAR
jgi:PAS domain S-box-containing protein